MLVNAELVLGNLDECDADAMSAAILAVSDSLSLDAVVLGNLTTSDGDNRDGRACAFDMARLVGCVTGEVDTADEDGFLRRDCRRCCCKP